MKRLALGATIGMAAMAAIVVGGWLAMVTSWTRHFDPAGFHED